MNMAWSTTTGQLPRQEVTIAEALKLRGYMTGHFGKWHVGQLSRTLVDSYLDLPAEPRRYAPPWESGFDKCFSGLQFPLFNPYYLTCWAYGSDDFTMVMNRPVARRQRTGGFVWISRLWRGPGQMVDEWLEGPLPEIIMDRTLDFIREARTVNRPFLACAWFFTPLHRWLPGQGTGRCTLPDRSKNSTGSEVSAPWTNRSAGYAVLCRPWASPKTRSSGSVRITDRPGFMT